MKIAVNTRLLLEGKLEGIGWFTYETLSRITRQHPDIDFIFIFDRPYSKSFIFSDNVRPIVLSPQARHPFLYYIWFNYSITRLLKREKPDLFLSPDGYLSLRTNIKQMAVFHDLNFEHYPNDLPRTERWFYRTFFPQYAQKAARIATVSTYSKQDIVKQYGVNKEKIDVVYNGANELYKPVDAQTSDDTRNEFTNGSPYFLFIGSLHPRKNLVNLFKAFDLFRKTDKNGVKLLIVGAKKWWTGDIKTTFDSMQYKDDVIFAGRQPAEALRNILASALALTYVSYFEGFGIPIVEAHYCDTPVITSNVTSMPEVAGDAALLTDPFNPQEIADAMTQIATQPELRATLVQRCAEQRKQFSWQQSADRLWNSILKAINE